MNSSVSDLQVWHNNVYRDVKLYLWGTSIKYQYRRLGDGENDSIRVVKGLIIDPTNFQDNEFAKEKTPYCPSPNFDIINGV